MTLYCQTIYLVLKIGLFIQNLSEKYKKLFKLLNCCTMKIPIRATQNKQRGRMQPAGRQFDSIINKQLMSLTMITLSGFCCT